MSHPLHIFLVLSVVEAGLALAFFGTGWLRRRLGGHVVGLIGAVVAVFAEVAVLATTGHATAGTRLLAFAVAGGVARFYWPQIARRSR